FRRSLFFRFRAEVKSSPARAPTPAPVGETHDKDMVEFETLRLVGRHERDSRIGVSEFTLEPHAMLGRRIDIGEKIRKPCIRSGRRKSAHFIPKNVQSCEVAAAVGSAEESLKKARLTHNL